MYFHGSREEENQKTALAISKDGLVFPQETEFGSAYFRVFQHENHYAMDAHGFQNHSNTLIAVVRAEQGLIPPITVEDGFGRRDDLRIRHSATFVTKIGYFFSSVENRTPSASCSASFLLTAIGLLESQPTH